MKTKIDFVRFKKYQFFILRDDLLEPFDGNKARKLSFLDIANLSNINHIVSCGSSQSNAMLAMAKFCYLKGIKFSFVVSHIDEKILKNPCGNLKKAINLGMNLFVSKNRKQFASLIANMQNLINDIDINQINLDIEFIKNHDNFDLIIDTEDIKKSIVVGDFNNIIGDKAAIFINEGVSERCVEYGFLQQADEIMSHIPSDKKISIFLPSGTGTSAAFLSKNINLDVYTCPCVGDNAYLKYQINQILDTIPSNLKILKPPKKFKFSKPYIELYNLWSDIYKESKIEFDLIYDTVGLLTMFYYWDSIPKDILYIHQGGLLGNETQLARYERKINANN